MFMKKGVRYDLPTLQKQVKTKKDITIHLRKLRSNYFGNDIIEKQYVETNGMSHVYKYRLKPNENWSFK